MEASVKCHGRRKLPSFLARVESQLSPVVHSQLPLTDGLLLSQMLLESFHFTADLDLAALARTLRYGLGNRGSW
jgi:hypothetical protein